MSDSDLPRSPFAGLADFSTRPPLRILSRDEIEQMLASHRLYLETGYHEGHRANFASADLSGQDFSGEPRYIEVARRAPPDAPAVCVSRSVDSRHASTARLTQSMITTR